MDVDLALVNVTVTDPHDRLVTGLEPDNFRIFENNVEEEILFFSSEDVPISVGVIFDLSGSMVNKIGKAKEAPYNFSRPPIHKTNSSSSVLTNGRSHEHLHHLG
jgi:Ca-activated chloride channel family protein